VHRGLLCAKKPSLQMRGEVRSLRKAGGKQRLSLRLTKGMHTVPSKRPEGRRFAPLAVSG
jgi:hypothetical protein